MALPLGVEFAAVVVSCFVVGLAVGIWLEVRATRRASKPETKQKDLEAPVDAAWPASLGSGLLGERPPNTAQPEPEPGARSASEQGLRSLVRTEVEPAQEPSLEPSGVHISDEHVEAVPYLNAQTGMPAGDACEAVPYLNASGQTPYEREAVEASDTTPTGRSPRQAVVPYLEPEVQRVSAQALPYLDPSDAVPYLQAVRKTEGGRTPTYRESVPYLQAAAATQQTPNPRTATQQTQSPRTQSPRTTAGGMDAGLREKLTRQQTKECSGEDSVDPLVTRVQSGHRREVVDEQLAAKFAEQLEQERTGGESKIEASLAPRNVSPRAMEPQLAARLERQRSLLEASQKGTPEGGQQFN